MLERYQDLALHKIFSEQEKYKTWGNIELLYLKYLSLDDSCKKDINFEQAQKKFEAIDWESVCAQVKEEEKSTKHDVVAFINVLEKELYPYGKYLHFGLTSSDILDTGLALIIIKAGELLLDEIKTLKNILWQFSTKYKYLPCVGRTHGRAADITTLGLKFLSHTCAVDRCEKDIKNSLKNISFGKLSGAVGNYNYVDKTISLKVLNALALQEEPIATQVIPRDRHARLLNSLATFSSVLERMAIEIRLLSYEEVGEVTEGFTYGQAGSSAMPHKKNPILSENICGLARMLRAFAGVSLENIALFNERDISHSSNERIIFADAFSLAHFMAKRCQHIVDSLVVNENKIASNLNNVKANLLSQMLLKECLANFKSRKEAYEHVQKAIFANNVKKEHVEKIDTVISRMIVDELFQNVQDKF